MNKHCQKGSAKALVIGFIAILAVCFATALTAVMYVVHLKDQFNSLQNSIHFTYESAKAIHSEYTLKITEMARVPALAAEQLSSLVTKALDARYGQDGMKALTVFIKEQNPSIPPELYTNLQKEIAGSRGDFTNKMNQVRDQKNQSYNILDSTVDGGILKFMGYPTKRIGYNGQPDDYPQVMSEQSSETFKTGIDKGVKF